MLALQAVVHFSKWHASLAGDAQRIDSLLGARGYEEETQEALEPWG